MEKNLSQKFYIKEYEILIENLNKISDDLLKIKWYFLASLGSIGLGYKYILDKEPKILETFLIGIFWKYYILVN